MMTKEEYLARAEADESWAPGWEAIDSAFNAVYPGIQPPHLGTEINSRAMFGGTEYLDGLSFYPSKNGYQHVVTYGMSYLYADESFYGNETNGWGYEMTMKVLADAPQECMWAVNSLAALARYTFQQERWFEPYQFISGGGHPIDPDNDTLLTSFLIAPDTELKTSNTVHGRLEFLQLVGITQQEADWLTAAGQDAATERGRTLAQRLIDYGNTDLVTDLTRTQQLV